MLTLELVGPAPWSWAPPDALQFERLDGALVELRVVVSRSTMSGEVGADEVVTVVLELGLHEASDLIAAFVQPWGRISL